MSWPRKSYKAALLEAPPGLPKPKKLKTGKKAKETREVEQGIHKNWKGYRKHWPPWESLGRPPWARSRTSRTRKQQCRSRWISQRSTTASCFKSSVTSRQVWKSAQDEHRGVCQACSGTALGRGGNGHLCHGGEDAGDGGDCWSAGHG